MPLVATQRKILSDYLVGVDNYPSENFIDRYHATVDLGGTETDVDYIATPVIWVNANSRFEVFESQNIATAISTGGSPLPGGAVIAVLVGSWEGVGFNEEDADLSAGDVKATVHFAGPADVLEEAFEWRTASPANQDAFKAQLFAQGITVNTAAQEITPTNLLP